MIRNDCQSERRLRCTAAGFTLLELVIVIAIISILAATVFLLLPKQTDIDQSKAKIELAQIASAAELMANESGGLLPPDVDRGLPNGIEQYLNSGDWPNAPWPGSYYDWDHWLAYPNGQVVSFTGGTVVHPGDKEIAQISIRFCPLNQPQNCQFPDEPWAKNFDYYSSAYYCISGPCRAHGAEPPDHPGYCFNCGK